MLALLAKGLAWSGSEASTCSSDLTGIVSTVCVLFFVFLGTGISILWFTLVCASLDESSWCCLESNNKYADRKRRALERRRDRRGLQDGQNVSHQPARGYNNNNANSSGHAVMAVHLPQKPVPSAPPTNHDVRPPAYVPAVVATPLQYQQQQPQFQQQQQPQFQQQQQPQYQQQQREQEREDTVAVAAQAVGTAARAGKNLAKKGVGMLNDWLNKDEAEPGRRK